MTTSLLAVVAGGLVGAWLASRLRLPFWPLTGAMVGAALAHLVVGGEVFFPTWWSTTAQVLVGAAVGSAVTPGIFHDFRMILAPGAVAVLAIIGTGLGFGLVIAGLGLADPITAVFGMVPGGVGEMVAAATVSDADPALVAGMHVVRLLVVLFSLPLLVRLARRIGAEGRGSVER